MTGAMMPYGGNDWLALTQEPILEPELPICDPHHHFWDFRLARIPYQRYLLHELMADVGSGHDVRSTVFSEARAMYRAEGPVEMRPVGEVEFVQGLAESIPFYSLRHVVRPGVTGWAQVRYTYGATVEDALEKLQYDLYYIKRLGVVFDLSILLSTIKIVILRRGSR
jgi:predicted TIM-barrel fold metal-dependent hydrolase